MNLVLNIGLSRADGKDLIPRAALRELANCGFTVNAAAAHRSDTELTLVADVTVEYGNTYKSVYALSEALGQECIAAYFGGGGYLIGPNAEAWGEFNPEFFLRLDGTRLSDPETTGYVPLSPEDVDAVKSAAVAEHAALWLHNFPQMLEAVILHKNAHLLKSVSPTL
jgi:hypothetical protein